MAKVNPPKTESFRDLRSVRQRKVLLYTHQKSLLKASQLPESLLVHGRDQSREKNISNERLIRAGIYALSEAYEPFSLLVSNAPCTERYARCDERRGRHPPIDYLFRYSVLRTLQSNSSSTGSRGGRFSSSLMVTIS